MRGDYIINCCMFAAKWPGLGLNSDPVRISEGQNDVLQLREGDVGEGLEEDTALQAAVWGDELSPRPVAQRREEVRRRGAAGEAERGLGTGWL